MREVKKERCGEVVIRLRYATFVAVSKVPDKGLFKKKEHRLKTNGKHQNVEQ